MLDPDAFRKLHPVEYCKQFLEKNTRPDGRAFHSFRSTSIVPGTVDNALGSCSVSIGETRVIAGVKAVVVFPGEVRPNEGRVLVNVELSPVCSPKFKVGRPSEQAVCLGHTLTTMLQETQALDYKVLCIQEGKAVWQIHVDLYCLNYDGNVFDACVIAVTTSLVAVTLPKIELNEAGDLKIDTEAPGHKITLHRTLTPASYAVVEGRILADPTEEEEELMTHAIGVVLDESQNLCYLHKSAGPCCTMSLVDDCISFAGRRQQALAPYVASVHRGFQ
eukprot:c9296_g1_i1.p1 GENE.c9296_g1_i1~~c9296_g1_i1.p1  ORF type:complete len:276 (+),score=49.56 c9296_g1_i1:48-875(+)